MKEDSNWRKAQRDSKESTLTVRRHFKTSWQINNLSWSYHEEVLRKSLPLCQLHSSSPTPDRTETNLESITGRYALPHSLEQHFLSRCWMVTGRNDRLQFTSQQPTPHCLGFRILFQPPSLLLDVEFQGVGSIPQANAGQQFVGQFAGQQYDFCFHMVLWRT